MQRKLAISLLAASVAGVGAVGFAFAGPALEKAGGKLTSHRDLAGTITSVSATSLTVQEASGKSDTYTLTPATKISVAHRKQGNQPRALLQPGERVFVGTTKTAATVAATIAIREDRLNGRVTQVGKNSYTIDTVLYGIQTVQTTSQTLYGAGKTSVKAQQPTVGNVINVIGYRVGPTTIGALWISLVKPLTEGTITALSAHGFTVLLRGGSTVKVNVQATTGYAYLGLKGAYSELRSGDPVSVVGATQADGSLAAERVQFDPTSLSGRVTTVGSRGFTLVDLNGTAWNVVANASTTTFWVGDSKNKLQGSRTDVKPGDALRIAGNVDQPQTITALSLEINPKMGIQGATPTP